MGLIAPVCPCFWDRWANRGSIKYEILSSGGKLKYELVVPSSFHTSAGQTQEGETMNNMIILIEVGLRGG